MLPVTTTTLVSRMKDRSAYPGVPSELQGYVRTEYAGDGAEVCRMLAGAARTAHPVSQRRTVLGALFEALSAAFPRPGGA